MNDIIIIGGGAAGMMAGITLAEKGYSPVIYEKNDKLGRKLFITGKGRCNLTNDCSSDELFKNVVTNPRFLYSAFSNFDSASVIDFFERLGLALKTERGGRVFPVSDHSSDVISVLSTALKRFGVEVKLNTEVLDIITEDVQISGEDNYSSSKIRSKVTGAKIRHSDGRCDTVKCENIVVATGGVSYPLTGSTGDGIRWAKELGLKVSEPHPALVPIVIREPLCKDLMGLALKNVRVSFYANVKNKDKVVFSDFGEMLFTHFGVSGPIILSASSYLGKYIDSGLRLEIDLKPALTNEQLDERILRDFAENMNKQFRNSLGGLLPKRLIPVVIEKTGIDPYKQVNSISKSERQELISQLKHFTLNVAGFRDFNEAIITQGGVSVKEINPGNMECKSIQGLRFIGEVLDVDALTGGFNLQIAWSTAAALE